MPINRTFKVVCDNCGSEGPTDSISLTAINLAKCAHFHIQGSIAICDACWEKGVRYRHVELARMQSA